METLKQTLNDVLQKLEQREEEGEQPVLCEKCELALLEFTGKAKFPRLYRKHEEPDDDD